MCMCVIPQSAHKGLKFGGASASPSIADKMRSLHKKLRSRDINMVGKHKHLHMLVAGLVSVRHDTWIIREN